MGQNEKRENEKKVSEMRVKAENDLKQQKENFQKWIDGQVEEMKNQREEIHSSDFAQNDSNLNSVFQTFQCSFRNCF